MAQKQKNGTAHPLDKDLDRLTRVEEVNVHVARSLLTPGLAVIFLGITMLFAVAFVSHSAGAALIIGAAVLAAYMAINIGANDVTNNMGAAVGAKALSMTSALILAAVFEVAGSMISGTDVIDTLSTGIIDTERLATPLTIVAVMMAALLSAACWINLATWLNAPISTTHSIVGSIVGAGLAAGGPAIVNWEVIAGISLSWIFSPLLGGVIAAGFLWFIQTAILAKVDKLTAARLWVPILISVMAGAFTGFLALKVTNRWLDISIPQALAAGLVAGLLFWLISHRLVLLQSIGLENRNQSMKVLFRGPLIVSGALMSYAHGANDVANAVGPLTAIVRTLHSGNVFKSAEVLNWVLVIGAFGIAVGVLLFGPRLIRLLGEKITKLNPVRAFCVSLSSALTVILATGLGLPVSSTHIAVGAVFGVGFFREWYMNRPAIRSGRFSSAEAGNGEDAPGEDDEQEQRRRLLVRRSHFMTIVASWVITVPASASVGAVLYWIIAAVIA